MLCYVSEGCKLTTAGGENALGTLKILDLMVQNAEENIEDTDHRASFADAAAATI